MEGSLWSLWQWPLPHILENTQPIHDNRPPCWKTNKTNWQQFKTLCNRGLVQDPNSTVLIKHFTINYFRLNPFLGEWCPAFRKLRKEQVTITRLYIGHSRLMHSFILEQEQQPQCSTCQTPCTIKHVLLECKVFNDTRKRYFHANIMKDLLPSKSLEYLLTTFNDIWKNSKLPESWKLSIIIAIPKPGKNNFYRSNYRPIVLTSCLYKTMEQMVNKKLVWFIESNNLFTNFQCGFRSQRSTIDHVVRLETSIWEAIIQKHLVE